jgi:hypothetical protein
MLSRVEALLCSMEADLPSRAIFATTFLDDMINVTNGRRFACQCLSGLESLTAIRTEKNFGTASWDSDDDLCKDMLASLSWRCLRRDS